MTDNYWSDLSDIWAPSAMQNFEMPAMRRPRGMNTLRESLTAFEPLRLLARAPGLAGQPRGDGRTVVVIPGYGAADASTLPLRSYLRMIGYDARGWGHGFNRSDVVASLNRAGPTVERFAARSQRRIPLIGWSLGGVVAREIARDYPDVVEQVITMGSPIVGGPRYTSLWNFQRVLGADIDAIERLIAERNRRPITVPITSIYSRTDGIVSAEACIDRYSPNVRNICVASTHLGLGIHHQVLREIARQLSASNSASTSQVA